MDVHNSCWEGFREQLNFGPAVHLDDLLIQIDEAYGLSEVKEMSEAKAIDLAHGVLRAQIEGGAVLFYAVAIRDRAGKNAWLGFSHNDAAEVALEGVFADALTFENKLRSSGHIFPASDGPLPSGRTDHVSDAQLAAMLGR